MPKRGDKYVRVYASTFGQAHVFPMKKKSEVYEALSLLFKRDGVPPKMIMDESMEQMKADFKKKLKEATYHQKQIEAHSPWQNTPECAIRELKKGGL